MARLRRARRQSLSIVGLGLLATAGFLISSIGAQASHPPSVTAEQHWDLLAESAEDLLANTTFDIERGVLPSGTTKFSPQPTATLEVVGRHQSGASNTSWRVDLVGNFTTLASVSFSNTDTTITRRPATITWSSSDIELDRIEVVKVNATAGNFDLRKVSIAIRQQGVIKKTVARVPLAAKQLDPQNVGPAIVGIPAFYRHVPADFSPAPTIKLRATGVGNSTTQVHVRLATAGGSQVSGSELTFSSNTITSSETGALSLVSSGTQDYVAQVWIVDVGGEGPEGESPTEPNTPGLYSADLVIEQATTDTRGISCTVGIYTGITSGVTLNSSSPSPLGYPFKAPTNTIPQDPSVEWQYAAKRTSASGWVKVKYSDNGSIIDVAQITDSANFSFQTKSLGTTAPQADNLIDSVASVADSSTTGTASMSRLRIKLCLLDLTLPSIYDLNITANPVFSPNGDNAKDTASFSAKLDDNFSFPVTASFEITPAAGGSPVATIPGTSVNSHQGTTTATWNGYTTGANPQVVDDGDYIVKVRATDAANNVKLSLVSVTVRVDKLKPTVSALSATELFFSPDGVVPDDKDTTTISGTYNDLNGPLTWRLAIKNSSGNEVIYWSDSHPSAMAKTWDGKISGQVVEGTYSAVLKVTDAAANFIDSTPLTGLVVDITLPTITGPTRDFAAISPNGDNFKETSTISATVSDANWQGWSIPITNGGTTVRTLSGPSTSISAVWDGKNEANPPAVVPDATYSATLRASDLAGNTRVASPLSITVDTTLPRLANFSAASPFSPNNDNKKETTAISGSIEDSSYPINWTLKITQGGNPVKTLATGTGGGVSGSWNGTDNNGLPVNDGIYDVTVTANDDVGLSTTGSPITVILDKTAPAISGFGATETLFSPNNPPDGRKDDTTINATLADANGPISYSLVITDSGGATVRSFPTSSGTSVSTLWNGKNNSSQPLGDGTYTATLTATDAADIVSVSAPLSLTLDTLAPSVTNLVADPGAFSPNDDGWKETTTIAATLGEANGAPTWDLALSGAPDLPSFSGTGIAVSALWDGKDLNAGDLSSGTYTATLDARDLAGNQRLVPTQVVIDKVAPTISALGASELFFSPNGDGVKDKTTIAASLGDVSPPLNWTVVIMQGSTTVRTLADGTGSSLSVDWDGQDVPPHVVDDGAYSATISVTDDQHLSASATINDIVVDTIFPTIADQVASEPVFSPNGDFKKDTTTISATLSDLNALSWSVAIKNSSNSLVRTLPGTGAAVSAEWNGCAQACPRQPDGSYTATVTGTDPAGNAVAPAPIPVTLDTHGPTLTQIDVSLESFSPNADDVKDSTTISAAITDANADSWRVSISNETAEIASMPGGGTTISETWNGADVDGDIVPDGQYEITVSALDAADNETVADPLPVLLDTVKPAIHGTYPKANGISTFSSQTLQAQLTDIGSGVLLQDIVFSVEAGEVPIPIQTASLNQETGLATTNAVTLVPGTWYTYQLNVTDGAGNEIVTDERRFLAASVTYPSSTAQIPETPCTLGPPEVLTNSRVATCPLVAARVSPVSVTMSGAPRTGTVVLPTAQLNFDSVKIRSRLGALTLEQSTFDASSSFWAPRYPLLRFPVIEAHLEPRTYLATSFGDIPLGQIETVVPAAWSNAYIQMDPINLPIRNPACPRLDVGSCASDGLTELVWEPTLSANHVADCDSVLTHSVAFVRTPGTGQAVSVSVDTARFTATDVALHYAYDTASGVVSADAGSGPSTFNFSLPEIEEGTVFHYTFVASGTFSDARCSRWSTAVMPTDSSYRTIAIGDVTSVKGWNQFAAAWRDFRPIIGNHPGYASYPPTETQVCSRFAVPTPCALRLQEPLLPPPDPEVESVIKISLADDPWVAGFNACNVWPNSAIDYKRSGGPTSRQGEAGDHRVAPTWYPNPDRIEAQYESFANADPVGNTNSEYIGTGPYFGIKTGLDYGGSATINVKVRILFRAKGHVAAYVTEFPACPSGSNWIKAACEVVDFFIPWNVNGVEFKEAALYAGIDKFNSFGTEFQGLLDQKTAWEFQEPKVIDESVADVNEIAPIPQDTGISSVQFSFRLEAYRVYGFWIQMRSWIKAWASLGTARTVVDFRRWDEQVERDDPTQTGYNVSLHGVQFRVPKGIRIDCTGL